MSTEFSVRLRSGFSIEDLRATSTREFDRALAFPGTMELVIVDSAREFVRAGADARRVPPVFLDHRYGEDGELGPEFVLMTPDAVAGVEVLVVDIGHPEDPEGGRSLFVDVSLDRTPVSMVLGVAAIISASRLTGSPIWDEKKILTGDRVVQAQDVSGRLLNISAKGADLHERAVGALRNLGWTGPERVAWYRKSADAPPD